MAAKTPTIIELGQSGGSREILCKFSDIDDGDTWASGLGVILGKVIDNETDGVVVSAAFSAGTFTFTVAGSGSNKAISMRVSVRS
jgi:hypothetical protein